jgi:HEPN domain-containing protein
MTAESRVRTHDLDDLAARLPMGWRARQSAGRLAELTSYAVDTRYPDPNDLPTASDAEQAVRQATALVRMVGRDLQERGLPVRVRTTTSKTPSSANQTDTEGKA